MVGGSEISVTNRRVLWEGVCRPVVVRGRWVVCAAARVGRAQAAL